MSEIRNPMAYESAKAARIRANANTTRRRALEAKVANDSAEFRCWLFSEATPELAALRDAAQADFDRTCNDDSEAQRAYHQAWEAWHKVYGYVPQFLREAMENWGGLTDGQLAFARKKFAELATRGEARVKQEEDRKSNAQPWTEGRQEVTGVILTIKSVESNSGPSWQNRSSMKCLLKTEDGRLLWTTVASALFYDESGMHRSPKGATVKMTVAVTPKEEDKTFGFGKRPSKASVVSYPANSEEN